MLELILLVLFAPFATGVYVAFAGRHGERRVAHVSAIAGLIHGLASIAIIVMWAMGGQRPIDIPLGDLYESHDYRFTVSLFVDSMSCLWLFLVTFLGGIVIRFSQTYLHKDPGYQRFFACLMFMMFGLTLLALAGGLDLLMAGWEFVGVCSFLMIAFYQERTLPVRNAFKVYSVYRFCDMGLLLGAWLSHVLWHGTQSFAVLRSGEMQLHLTDVGQASLFDMTGLILLAAVGKSAQFPFTFWLSRAMEGPTPSTAIFYGALSVHAGVFLLIRTFPIWQAAEWGPWLVGGVGLTTVIVASCIGRVQNNIKGQIAYSSAVHVGMMFIELAFGLKQVAMIHMFGNACLRCYQLLVSPSVVVSRLRLQGSISAQALLARSGGPAGLLPKSLAMSLYVFAINDGFLERLTRWMLWRPMTAMGRWIHRYEGFFFWGLLPIAMIAAVLAHADIGLHSITLAVLASALMMFGLTVAALAETKSAVRAWNAVMGSNVMAALAVWLLLGHIGSDLLFFGSGLAVFWLLGLQALLYLGAENRTLPLSKYLGLSSKHPGGSWLLFISVLGMTGFPISPTFIGQDVLLHHAVNEYVWLAFALAFSFAVNGLAVMRIYAKVCLGQAAQ